MWAVRRRCLARLQILDAGAGRYSNRVTTMDDPTESKKTRSLPTVEAIRTIHNVYRELQQGTANSFKAAAANLEIKPDTLTTAVERFEEVIGTLHGVDSFRVFSRKRGQRAELVRDPRVAQLMRDIADFIDAYERIRSPRQGRLTIRIGASLAACSFLSPKLINDKSFSDIAFEFGHGKPLTLRNAVDRGDYDLALVAVSDDFNLDADHVRHTWSLPMALICPRGHWTEAGDVETEDGHFDWSRLADDNLPMVLLREEPSRHPIPRYPLDKFPDGLTVHRLSSTSLCYQMVMERAAVTISLPQFLTVRQRESLHITRHKDFGEVRLALLSSSHRKLLMEVAEERLEAVDRVLVGQLSDLEKGSLSEVDPVSMHMYHITHLSVVTWLKGKLVWRVDGRSISGLYLLQDPESPRQELEFALRGHVTTSPIGCHVACRATEKGETDEFVLNLTCRTPELVRVEMVGVWAGRSRWRKSGSFQPYVGPVVISQDEKTIDELNRLVSGYWRENAMADLQLPAPALD